MLALAMPDATHNPTGAAATFAAVPSRSTQDARRYAIYCAPHRDSAWWRFGCAWLGRDAVADCAVAHSPLPRHDAAAIARMTAVPRRYGFHATLKPPFRLAQGCSSDDVYLQAATLAATLMSVTVTALHLTEIGDFVALGFRGSDASATDCHTIAAQCVACFDNLRARPDAAKLARRQAAGLTPRQSELLAAWGYPYVFDEFCFHFTLTGPLPRAQRRRVIEALSPWVGELQSAPMVFDALSVYMQPASDAPFVATRRYGFDGCVQVYRNDPQ